MCNEFYLKIWGFKDKKVEIYKTYQVFRPLAHIRTLKDNILLV